MFKTLSVFTVRVGYRKQCNTDHSVGTRHSRDELFVSFLCLPSSLHLPTFAFACLPVRPSVCLSVCVCVPVCLSFCLSLSLSFSVSVCLSVHLSSCLLVCLPVSVSLSISVFVCLSVCLCRSVSLSFCLPPLPLPLSLHPPPPPPLLPPISLSQQTWHCSLTVFVPTQQNGVRGWCRP